MTPTLHEYLKDKTTQDEIEWWFLDNEPSIVDEHIDAYLETYYKPKQL